MSKPGRQRVIKDDIAEILAKMKDRHDDWSIRILEKKFDQFAKATGKSHLIGKGPKRTAINKWIPEYQKNEKEMGIERIWSSAELNRENIDSVIATWAEIYAYREKIDTLAGIKNPDFTDLDSNIANADFKAIYQYNENYLYDAMGKIANRDDVVKKDLEVFDNQYLLPSLIDQIRFQEIEILVHSLGEPDMSHKSIRLYSTILAWILLDNPQFFKDLMKLPYVKRRNLLTSIREWVKDNPDINDDNIIALKVNELFDSVWEKGKNKTKFKKGYRITIDDLQKMKENYEKEGGANG